MMMGRWGLASTTGQSYIPRQNAMSGFDAVLYCHSRIFPPDTRAVSACEPVGRDIRATETLACCPDRLPHPSLHLRECFPDLFCAYCFFDIAGGLRSGLAMFSSCVSLSATMGLEIRNQRDAFGCESYTRYCSSIRRRGRLDSPGNVHSRTLLHHEMQDRRRFIRAKPFRKLLGFQPPRRIARFSCFYPFLCSRHPTHRVARDRSQWRA